MFTRLIVLGAAAFSWAMTTNAWAVVHYQTAALTGQPTGIGSTTFLNMYRPRIDSSGNVMLPARISSANDTGLWTGTPGNLSLVAATNQHAPGTPPGVFFNNTSTNFFSANMAPDGKTAFFSSVSGPGIDQTNHVGVWGGTPGNLNLIARKGSQANDMPAGVLYDGFGVEVDVASNGQVAFHGLLGPTTAGLREALYGGAFSNPRLLAVQGGPAPGAEPGATFTGFLSFVPAINGSGRVAFRAFLTNVPSGTEAAIYSGPTASALPIARGGQPAPDVPQASYRSFSLRPLIAADGNVAFESTLAGPGVQEENNETIYVGSPASPRLVAREGNAAPGAPAGVNYRSFRQLSLGTGGRLFFEASTTVANRNGLWRTDGNEVLPVALSGQQAVGVPAGDEWLDFNSIDINESGQIAFFGRTISPTGTRRFGLWASDPDGNLFLIARDGGQIDLGGGDVRTIFLDPVTENIPDGFLSDTNQVAFRAAFDGDGYGVFLATVPEPSMAGMFAAVAALLLRRRWRAVAR